MKDRKVLLGEAVDLLERHKATQEEAEFQCDGHWAIGWNESSGYWWSYYCCETCDQWDYEQVESPGELCERFKDHNGEWFQTEPLSERYSKIT